VANNAATASSKLALYAKITDQSANFESSLARVSKMTEMKTELSQMDLEAMRAL